MGVSERKERALMNKLTIACVSASALALALSGCVSKEKYEASQQRNTELEQEYQQLQQQMGAELGAQDMQITRLQNAIKVSINSELLFPSGKWEMSDRAKQSIAKVAAILAPHQKTKVIVDGYTDTAPIGPGLMKEGITSNLVLSQKRAETVMQYMISQGVKPGLISAQGFGEANPVASNSTPDGRAKNRRVELNLASAAQ
jgi:chemotaxis protein MotB